MSPIAAALPDTPAALVDLDRMEANLRRTAGYCRTHGLAWRPHAKTHKTPALGAAQIAAGAVGLTVATLREAEVFADVAPDLLLAYPPVGEAKCARLRALLERGARVTVGLDSRTALDTVARAAAEAQRTVDVLVELDLGMKRVGIGDVEAALDLARHAAGLASVRFAGVMFYPGHIRRVEGDDDPQIAALGAALGRFLETLERAGLPPGVVSGGSTPTLWHSHLIPGLTEVRPGTTIFNDRSTVASGACGAEECAYTVLATVVSTAVEGQAVVDAGSKALAREELRPESGGYGALLGREEVVVRAVSEEHGILDLSATTWRPAVGDLVRIVPNHVCVSVNLQERLWGVRGDEVVEEWEVLGRGRAEYGRVLAASAALASSG
jgi:D-serine deaminase-like pyridoxal phosphate-dependent protein